MFRAVFSAAVAAFLCAGLSACGGTLPASSSANSSGSGITVFGDVDSSVSRTR